MRDKTTLHNLIRDYILFKKDKNDENKILCDNIERVLSEDFEEKNVRLGKIYYQSAFSDDEIEIIYEALLFSKSIDTETAEKLMTKLKKNLFGTGKDKDKINILKIKEMNLIDKKELRKNLSIIQDAIDKATCINFYFNGYDSDKKLCKVRQEKYIVTPYYIVAYDGKYYLIAATKKYKSMSIWRIDLMTEVELSNDKQNKEHNVNKDAVKNLDKQWTEKFIYTHPDMSYDVPIGIELKLYKKEKFSGADYKFLFDKFGSSFQTIKQHEDYDEVLVTCSPYAITNLAIQYADRLEIVEPKQVRDMIKEKMDVLKKIYS